MWEQWKWIEVQEYFWFTHFLITIWTRTCYADDDEQCTYENSFQVRMSKQFLREYFECLNHSLKTFYRQLVCKTYLNVLKTSVKICQIISSRGLKNFEVLLNSLKLCVLVSVVVSVLLQPVACVHCTHSSRQIHFFLSKYWKRL